MNEEPTFESPNAADRRPFAERPAVAAVIVFSPIAISIVLLIIYVLSHRQ